VQTGALALPGRLGSDKPFDHECTRFAVGECINHLNWNLQVPNTIKLAVSKGLVTLQGTAAWQYQKEETARVVRSLRGGKEVSDGIALKPTLSAVGVKIKIEEALKRDAQIEAKDIAVDAVGNAVTLRGHVHSLREREDAEHAAFAAPGVGRVNNLLTVTF